VGNSGAFDQLIWQTAGRHGVDPYFVKAVVAAESNFEPKAYRAEPQIGDASYGLMQTLYRTAKDMGYSGPSEGLFDPATSVEYGTKYLAYQLRRYTGKLPYAAAAYNAGTAYADASGRFRNQTYVDRVMGFYRQFGGGGAAQESEVSSGVRLRSDLPQIGPVPGSTPVRLQAVAGPDGERGASIETFINADTAPWVIAVGGAMLLSLLAPRRRD
jgi:Transglycosylase SLT domain